MTVISWRLVAVILTMYLVTTSINLFAVAKSENEVLSSGAFEEEIPAYNARALHRVDFRVTGKSCAICLHKIQQRMKGLPGTVKAAVMLRPPYGAVVIYDASKLSLEKILQSATENEPAVKLVDVKDIAIKKLPIVLVPELTPGPNTATNDQSEAGH